MVEEFQRLSFKTVGTIRKANTGNSIVIEAYGKKAYVSIKDMLDVVNEGKKIGTVYELGKWEERT